MQKRIEIMGMEVDCLSEDGVVDRVHVALDRGCGGWVITPNLDHLHTFRGDAAVRRMFARADIVVADGMPLVWASRLLGAPLPERVAGSDLIWSLTEQAAVRGRSIFLLGGAPGACDEAALRLRDAFPELRVAGTLCPPHGFERERGWHSRIVAELERTQPDIVYVGLGFPKQERLIGELRSQFPRTWFLGIGISISFVAGEVSRAPRWMQRSGLEWLHRLAQEPRRLVRRYLLIGIPFAARLLLWSALHGPVSPREPAYAQEELSYDAASDALAGVQEPVPTGQSG
jgi:N-acetylglucosaminyldiphosphoundecaprenol N-acetyl-beta-D-mannosaminyltransferase